MGHNFRVKYPSRSFSVFCRDKLSPRTKLGRNFERRGVQDLSWTSYFIDKRRYHKSRPDKLSPRTKLGRNFERRGVQDLSWTSHVIDKKRYHKYQLDKLSPMTKLGRNLSQFLGESKIYLGHRIFLSA
jgi:hypothetical protein